MAGHYSINNPEEEMYPIFLFIEKCFQNGIDNIDTNLFYELGKEYSFVIPNARVFEYRREVNGCIECFEVHYNPKNKKLIDVFWVC